MANSGKSFSTSELLIVICATLFLVIYNGFTGSIFRSQQKLPNYTQGAAISKKDNSQKTSLLLTGDVMLGRTVQAKSRELNNLNYPFEEVAAKLQAADLVYVNLENSLNEDCPEQREGYLLCASPEAAGGLAFAGIDVANLANNHTGAFGKMGIESTKNVLRKVGIESTGLGSLVDKMAGGTRFGFLGFDFTSKLPTAGDYELITRSKSKVDVLIVGAHWGMEYSAVPNDYQIRWAKAIIEAGADVIAGHHPHWIQTVDYINGKPVYYSLGNFVFDQMWSEETKKGMVIRLTFEGAKLIKEERLSTYMSSWAQPAFVEEK